MADVMTTSPEAMTGQRIQGVDLFDIKRAQEEALTIAESLRSRAYPEEWIGHAVTQLDQNLLFIEEAIESPALTTARESIVFSVPKRWRDHTERWEGLLEEEWRFLSDEFMTFTVPVEEVTGAKGLKNGLSDGDGWHSYRPVVDIRVRSSADPQPPTLRDGERSAGQWYRLPLDSVAIHRIMHVG